MMGMKVCQLCQEQVIGTEDLLTLKFKNGDIKYKHSSCHNKKILREKEKERAEYKAKHEKK